MGLSGRRASASENCISSFSLEIQMVRTTWKTVIQREYNIKMYLRTGLSDSKQVAPQAEVHLDNESCKIYCHIPSSFSVVNFQC